MNIEHSRPVNLHILFSLSGRPDILLGSGWNLKESSPKYGPKKSKLQKTGS